MRPFLASLYASALLALGVVGVAGAQPQQGLVNVNIEDVTVVVPINAAANICGINVVALSTLLAPTGTTTCTARSGQEVTVSR